MIRILEPFIVGFYAARVANRLIDLGVKADAIGADLRAILYEIERDRRKELNPHEAAAYFFGAAFSNFPPECYCLPISQLELAHRAEVIMANWVRKRKMRLALAVAVKDSLSTQLPLFQLP